MDLSLGSGSRLESSIPLKKIVNSGDTESLDMSGFFGEMENFVIRLKVYIIRYLFKRKATISHDNPK